MHTFYVYILECSDKSYYVGHTDNIYVRLEQHLEATIENSSYVSKRLPARVVYVEPVDTRHAAQDFERRLKGWSRKKKEALIKGGFLAVKQLHNKSTHSTTTSTSVRSTLREDGGSDSSMRSMEKGYELSPWVLPALHSLSEEEEQSPSWARMTSKSHKDNKDLSQNQRINDFDEKSAIKMAISEFPEQSPSLAKTTSKGVSAQHIDDFNIDIQ